MLHLQEPWVEYGHVSVWEFWCRGRPCHLFFYNSGCWGPYICISTHHPALRVHEPCIFSIHLPTSLSHSFCNWLLCNWLLSASSLFQVSLYMSYTITSANCMHVWARECKHPPRPTLKYILTGYRPNHQLIVAGNVLMYRMSNTANLWLCK